MNKNTHTPSEIEIPNTKEPENEIFIKVKSVEEFENCDSSFSSSSESEFELLDDKKDFLNKKILQDPIPQFHSTKEIEKLDLLYEFPTREYDYDDIMIFRDHERSKVYFTSNENVKKTICFEHTQIILFPVKFRMVKNIHKFSKGKWLKNSVEDMTENIFNEKNQYKSSNVQKKFKSVKNLEGVNYKNNFTYFQRDSSGIPYFNSHSFMNTTLSNYSIKRTPVPIIRDYSHSIGELCSEKFSAFQTYKNERNVICERGYVTFIIRHRSSSDSEWWNFEYAKFKVDNINNTQLSTEQFIDHLHERNDFQKSQIPYESKLNLKTFSLFNCFGLFFAAHGCIKTNVNNLKENFKYPLVQVIGMMHENPSDWNYEVRNAVIAFGKAQEIAMKIAKKSAPNAEFIYEKIAIQGQYVDNINKGSTQEVCMACYTEDIPFFCGGEESSMDVTLSFDLGLIVTMCNNDFDREELNKFNDEFRRSEDVTLTSTVVKIGADIHLVKNDVSILKKDVSDLKKSLLRIESLLVKYIVPKLGLEEIEEENKK